MLFRPPHFIRRIYPTAIWNFPNEKEGIFLTFDDGPVPQVTPWVLDQLDQWSAKATFFVTGKNVELYPDLFREILSRGHAVGNHTYSHIQGWRMAHDDYIADVDMADQLIGSRLFRPPYAKISIVQANLLSERYTPVMWSILSRDYNRRLSRRSCVKNVLPYLAPGEVVVFHDSMKASKNLWYALPRTLEEISGLNLECKPIII